MIYTPNSHTLIYNKNWDEKQDTHENQDDQLKKKLYITEYIWHITYIQRLYIAIYIWHEVHYLV